MRSAATERVPSIDMLEVIAEVFQKDPAWFLDDAVHRIGHEQSDNNSKQNTTHAIQRAEH